MSGPTLVIFDLDDTLYEYEPSNAAGGAALAAFADRELGVSPAAFTEAISAARSNVKRRVGAVAASHSRLLYCHEALELLGLRSQPQIALAMEQEYWRNYLLASKLRQGAEELLDLLRYNGVTTAIVTDLTAQIQFRKMVHFNIADRIDHVVCSEETAGEKPVGAPFDLLFDRLNPELLANVWFIGDQPYDAPVEACIAESRIRSGRGFVRGHTGGGLITNWSEFSEIEAIVEKTFRTESAQ